MRESEREKHRWRNGDTLSERDGGIERQWKGEKEKQRLKDG